MYNVFVSVTELNSSIILKYGNELTNFKLHLLCSSGKDYKHYDIIDYCNQNLKVTYSKRKILEKDEYNLHNNKKIKFEKSTNSDSDLILKPKTIHKNRKSCNLMDTSFFGEMDYVCKFCSAVYWKEESKKSICCHKGKIILSPLSTYNEQLKSLLLHDKQFRLLIRYYNNLFCFATFNANVQFNEKRKAIYNLKIQGQVCHTTPNFLVNSNNKEESCGQLYIYDNDTATEKRLQKNDKVLKEHLSILTDVMNENPYALKYKYLNQLSNIQNMPNYRLYFIQKNNQHKHRYNKPLTSECGAIIVSKSGIPDNYDLCVYPKCSSKDEVEITYLNRLSHHVDPMVFPLLFPKGDLGWSIGYTKNPKSKEQLTILQYYSYRLAYRPNSNFSPLLFSGRLTQQYFLQAYIMVENNRMNFFRQNQKQLRIECYQGLVDHVMRSASNISTNFEKERIGNIFILPSTYIGSPRYMQQHYQDAMAICRSVDSKIDIFMTITCNPKWEELQLVLKGFPPHCTPNDIPNITVRLFYAKFKSILNDITNKKLFGTVIAYIYTIEFQKRGLPHAHLVITLHPKDKLLTPEAIDKHISAEIPTNDDDLRELVLTHMLHGPHTSKSPCFDKNKKCKSNFPKCFQTSTRFQKHGYPLYKRENNISENHMYHNRNNNIKIPVDNSMVVPYNKFLLKKYRCHINVEYCYSIQSVKYIFDYIHKGGDLAYCKLKKIDNDNKDTLVYDEITKYVNGRYLSPMEAAWRLQEYPLCGRDRSVIPLAVHTENQQCIIFEEYKEIEAINKHRGTTLTAWFDLNKIDKFAQNIKYVNIPRYYRYDLFTKLWVKRVYEKKNYAIGRLRVVSPKDSERFFLKLILNRVKGITSFTDLRTHNGITYKSYKETAIAMDLIAHDNQINNIFEEAVSVMLPYQLRQFFAWFLLSENIQGNIIWEKFKKYFGEDFSENQEQNALVCINKILLFEEMSCKDFSLPEPDQNFMKLTNDENCNVSRECKTNFESMYIKLNEDQKLIFDNLTNNTYNMFFIDGPGGSGKTFLYKTLIYYFLSIEKNVVSMAWTGIASILLPKGITSHRAFRLPLDLDKIETAFLKFESDKQKLRNAHIIIWDEASMIPKKALEIVDSTLRDLCNNDIPFGGKLIVLGGDFRQILPVIKKSYNDAIVEETIKYSRLWPFFKIFKLSQNLRSENKKFSALLLKIGDGTINSFKIPDKWKTDDICSKLYKNINLHNSIDRVILAPHNDDVRKINNKVLKLLNGETQYYYSIDYATHKGTDQCDENIHLNYPIEMLNNIREGLPPHKLCLKINAIIMLIRNLSIDEGLCNGTRLKITKLYKYNLEAEIITGEKMGNKVFIPRITLDTTENSLLPFILHRKQFPIVLAFAITINKSQGQSFNSVGLYIGKPLFSHGQLYVALSRCRNPNKIYIQNHAAEIPSEIVNIVWKKVFNI